MTDDEADEGSAVDSAAEREQLRRLAFGRTTTDAEVAAAATARLRLGALEAEDAARALEREERARADREASRRARALAEAHQAHPLTGTGTGTSAVTGTGTGTGTGEDEDEGETDPEPARWRARLLPAAVGLLVGAAVVGGVVWATVPAPGGTVAQSPSPAASGGVNYFLGEPPVGEELPPGDVAAAQRWFAPAQTEEDLVGVPELREDFDRGSVRLVHSSPAARVWVARKTDGSLCLETTETASQITSGSCVIPEEFARRSLLVGSDALTAVWSGSELSVVLAGP